MKYLLLLMILPFSAHAEVLQFGIVPQQSASRLAQQWVPIMAYLSEKTGHQIEFATAPDIPTFEKRLKAGVYDFAYMNPYHFTVYSDSPGYQAMSKAKNKQIQGIIVARRDSGIRSLEQLKGVNLAFPSPAAFAASIITQSDLASGDIPYVPFYVSSHDSVYLSVARGLYPAGGGVMRTFTALDEEVREQLSVIWTTQGYTPHAIASHPRVSTEVKQDVSEALALMGLDKLGEILLKPLKVEGFENASDSEWDDVRALKLNVIQP